MDAQLSHEMMLLQQSRCNKKYQEMITEMPEKVNQSLVKPMNKFSRTISRLVKNRGRMLFILDKQMSKIFNK